MSPAPNPDLIASVVEGRLTNLGLDLEAVEIATAGTRRVLRIAVDSDAGPSMDDIADATAVISATLDDADLLGERPYTLEVTSRGVDRPLSAPRHWRRNVGRLVEVTTVTSDRLTGRILKADERAATIDDSGQSRTVGYDQIRRALVQVEFNRPDPRAALTAEGSA
ncbi:MAG: ribosome maturation factor RimP [Nocardioides sp.]